MIASALHGRDLSRSLSPSHMMQRWHLTLRLQVAFLELEDGPKLGPSSLESISRNFFAYRLHMPYKPVVKISSVHDMGPVALSEHTAIAVLGWTTFRPHGIQVQVGVDS